MAAAEMVVVRLAALLVLLAMPAASVHAQLVHDFYRGKCPGVLSVEGLVSRVVRSAYDRNRAIAPGLIRLHFHDAFVLGADASVLINATGSEKYARPNLSLQDQAFEVVNTAKALLEARCPGVVSCADILTFAARDSVRMTLGGRFPVRSGRRDGLTSSSSLVNLPKPVDGVTELTNAFTTVGLTQADMVILSGAHTVGVSHCQTIRTRLYNFSSTSATDPSLDPEYAAALKARCPPGSASDSTPLNLDPLTPNNFDVNYYRGLQAHKGLLHSDQALFDSPATRPLVDTYSALHGNEWRFMHFPFSFNKMAEINVSTGTQGEIRQSCWKFNSS